MTEELQQGVRPLLTIAIPTYNRALYLKGLLEDLAEQLKNETAVELLVSDNASTDATPIIVEEAMRTGLKVTVLRNAENIGPDANFQQCFERARGKYVWVFGDDDLVVPGGISKIVAHLHRDEYGIVYLSPYEFLNDYLAETKTDRFGRVTEVLTDGLQVVRRAGALITFISAIIVNKDQYNRSPHPPLSKFVGTNMLQLGWVCPVLAVSSRNLYVWEKLVAGRGGNCGGWGAGQVFGINLKEVAFSAFGDRTDIATELCNMILRWWFPETIMECQRGSKNSLLQEDMQRILQPVYKTNWRYWIYVYPLLNLPLQLAKVWHSGIKFVNRLGRLPLATVGYFSVLDRKLRASEGVGI